MTNPPVDEGEREGPLSPRPSLRCGSLETGREIVRVAEAFERVEVGPDGADVRRDVAEVVGHVGQVVEPLEHATHHVERPHCLRDLGAAQGVKAAGKQGAVKVVVFDAVPGIDEQIRSGLVDIAIAQRPDEIGYYGVKFAADAIRGKKIPPFKSTGFIVLDKSNIDKPEMKQYIYSN